MLIVFIGQFISIIWPNIIETQSLDQSVLNYVAIKISVKKGSHV